MAERFARKACPVLLRSGRRGAEVLAFRHPLAGLQLVKGGIEPGEWPVAAARRELHEESGLVLQGRVHARWRARIGGQDWHFILWRRVRGLRRTWAHDTSDGGRLQFRFFWHPLALRPGVAWHPVFRRALRLIARHVRGQDA